MFGLGANELILILLFGFIIFGPDKLPAMAKTIGKAITKFRTAQAEMNNVIKNEVYNPDSDDPFKNPLDALSQIEEKVKKEDKGESFTDRKARYDKQREAKKAAEERRAKKLAQVESAHEPTDEISSSAVSETQGAVPGNTVDTKEENASHKQTEGQGKKKYSADELYGTMPKAKKPTQKKSVHNSGAGNDKPSTSDVPVEHVLKEAVDDTVKEEGE